MYKGGKGVFRNYYYYSYVGYSGYNFSFGVGIQYNRGKFKISLVEESLKNQFDFVAVLLVIKITKSEAKRLENIKGGVESERD